MHRVPKIFANSPNRRLTDADSGSGEGSSSSRHGAKPKPRLDRRNARKNINYSSEESLRMRSLYLNGGNTSLRIDGVDGEIDFLCQYLGFSGIDDFSINPDEYYVAMKVRSSSAPVVFSRTAEKVDYDDGGVEVVDSLDRVIEDSGYAVRYLDHCGEVVSGNSEENRDYCNIDRSRNDVFGGKLVDSVRVSEVILSNNVSGIKGARPPVLAAPPTISLPKIDKECSTWDLFRAFGPDNDTSISRFEREVCFKEDEAGGRKRKQDEELEGGLRRGMAREENCVPAGLHSFTRNLNNDDSSSTITHPMSSISPDGRFCIISAWQKGGLLGRGSFGSVYEGIADDGFFFAAKEVSLLDQGDEGQQRINQLEQEIALLSRFQHENIVQYYGTAKDESHLYIFLELVNQGSLLSLYQKYTLKDSAVSGYTRQILHGLRYLHDRNVVHRDIKCANLLVDTNGSVKLADFGLAKATKLNDVKSCKGTAFWMAPEVVRSQGYGLAADIWSLGCTVLEMLTKRFPYANLECMPALFRIGKGERPPIPDSLSSDARDFILKCLQADPSLRPTAAQLLDHPFVKRPLPSSLGFRSPRNSVRRN